MHYLQYLSKDQDLSFSHVYLQNTPINCKVSTTYNILRMLRICFYNRIRVDGTMVAPEMQQFASLAQSLEVYPIRFYRSIERSFLTNQPVAITMGQRYRSIIIHCRSIGVDRKKRI